MEPQPPQLTPAEVEREDDEGIVETEPVANTSTEHMRTQADVGDCVKTHNPTTDEQLPLFTLL